MDNDLITTPYFTHLHVHTHYSILDGMSSIPDLVEKCLRTGMDALAITDHGTMYGIKKFFDYVDKKNSKLRESGGKLFKPIFGCEVYVARQTPTNPTGSRLVKEHKENGSGYHLILLAKNEQGYHNLCKIVPPLSEQQSIASYLDTKCAEIDALIAIKQAKIDELKDYKKSVIYEYVTGKKEVV